MIGFISLTALEIRLIKLRQTSRTIFLISTNFVDLNFPGNEQMKMATKKLATQFGGYFTTKAAINCPTQNFCTKMKFSFQIF